MNTKGITGSLNALVMNPAAYIKYSEEIICKL